jgi:hypothetical protein
VLTGGAFLTLTANPTGLITGTPVISGATTFTHAFTYILTSGVFDIAWNSTLYNEKVFEVYFTNAIGTS